MLSWRESVYVRVSPCFQWALLFLALLPAAGWACSIPVCRYALDNWTASPYRAVVFYQDAPPPELQTLKDLPQLNLSVTTIDVRQPIAEPWAAVWEQEKAKAQLPWLVLFCPREASQRPPVTAEPLSASTVAALAGSPAQTTLAQHLLAEQGTAWVFLRSGKAEQDDAALRTLEETTRQFSATWTPKPDPADPAPIPPQTTPRFPIVSINRNDPAERLFVAMLLGSEPDLADYDDTMAFMVFGRGRALYALVGKGITSETVRSACAYVSGPCSCIVKDEHPGVDLMLNADWSKAAPAAESTAPPQARAADIPQVRNPAVFWAVPLAALLLAFFFIVAWTLRASRMR